MHNESESESRRPIDGAARKALSSSSVPFYTGGRASGNCATCREVESGEHFVSERGGILFLMLNFYTERVSP